MAGISEKVFSDWQWQNRAEASRKATSTEEKERKAQEPSRGQGMSSAMRCFLSSKVVIKRFFFLEESCCHFLVSRFGSNSWWLEEEAPMFIR